MAIDNTPPRLRLIMTIGVIVVITLFSLEFVFKSYYAMMTDEAKREKTAPKTDLFAQLALEREALAAGKLPVEQAMSQVARGARPDLIDPKPSEDLAPMTGWNKLPKPLPVPAPAPNDVRGTAVAPAADGGVAMTDGGAAMTDAAMPNSTKEAGPPGPAPTPAHTGMRPPGNH